ncbi:Hypothetical predicted protein [Paramuricea clavata]|uniref:CxC5 like cysteine cluster associated with KDZ domain-containing protein n=1 Tax=Paramuricea clavata TaxID=317549 RepID=A0A7D9DIZ2_PARCT|nr:Hypothetical predicted protein [Paramuricea clavata]
MSTNQGKKRKCVNLLNYEAIKEKATVDKEYIEGIRERISKLKDVDIERLLSGAVNLCEDEALHILSAKLSVRCLYFLCDAIRHVPDNVNRVTNGIPVRTNYIFKLFTSMAAANGQCAKVSIDELSTYIKFIEKYCDAFLRHVDNEEHLWQLTKKEEITFNKFLTPPVSICSSCEKNLTVRNNPSKAKLFTLEGPIPCTKITLECRRCSHVYDICNYTDTSGTHFYVEPADIVEISDVTFMEMNLYKWFPALSNHSWVSFSGFSEAYNDVCEDTIHKYASVVAGQTEAEDLVAEDVVGEGNGARNINVLPGEMSPKVIAKCFWRREVEEELTGLGLRDEWVLSNKSTGPLSGTLDNVMEMVDKMRCERLYSHQCSEHCKSKGCGQLYVADGNWKLRYCHCMWKVPVSLHEFGQINNPNICPLSPKRGHAFCQLHCVRAAALGVPSELRQFYKYCGLNFKDKDEALEEISEQAILAESSSENMASCLESISGTKQDRNDYNATSFQGTTDFLEKNPSFVKDQSCDEETSCNKDTGGLKALHSWSRGIFFIVSAGGHIEYWQPLYRSESPTQAFVVTILWLYRKFKGMKNEFSDDDIRQAMSSICLAYDNMCHMDSLKIAKRDLPLPKPFDECWKLISKVIDRLHLRNHVDPKCERMYNADEKVPPQFNTMACEQIFIWASRFKKVMCAMPHVHQFFSSTGWLIMFI